MPNPNYMRKWKISVLLKSGVTLVLSSSEAEASGGALRCVFSVDRPGYQAPYYADIDVYNLSNETENLIFEQGEIVTIEAGYQEGNFGPIWEGDLYQAFLERENVVDYKMTLHCIDGLGLFDNNLTSMALAAGSTPADTISAVTGSAVNEIPVQYVTRYLKVNQLPRGRTFFCSPRKVLEQVIRDNNSQMFIKGGELNISKITDQSVISAVVSPSTGLVGTPRQIQYGVQFVSLLNPNLDIFAPPMTVKLDQSQIRIQKVYQGQLQSRLDEDGFYKVVKVHHFGDTRGNDWFTEVTGVNSDHQGLLPSALGGITSISGLPAPGKTGNLDK